MNLLSGRDPAWTQTMTHLMLRGRLADRTPLGMSGNPQPGDPITITLSPDFESALLEIKPTYTITNPDGASAQVALVQTEYYRRNEQEWLLSPPPGEMWGTTLEYSGDRLFAAYPNRDNTVASRLLPDLNATLGLFCQSISCPTDGPLLTLRLSTNPETLLAIEDPEWLLESGDRLFLPSPSLVGLPRDDEAYQALFRTYARWTVAAVANKLLDYECCHNAGNYRFLLEELFHELNLSPSPVTTSALQVALQTPDDTLQPGQSLAFVCRQPETLAGEVYLFDWEQQELTKLATGPKPGILPLSGDAGLVLNNLALADGGVEQQIRVWRQGESQIVYRTLPEHILNIRADDPQNRMLVVGISFRDPQSEDLTAGLDLQRCTDIGCQLLPLAGRPLWSPDGSRTLLMQSVGNQTIFVGNGEAQTLFTLHGVSTPSGVFAWKDNDTFYSTTRNTSVPAVIEEWTSDGEATTLLSFNSESMARTLLSSFWRTANVGYNMLVNPRNSQQIILDVTATNPMEYRYLMLVDLENNRQTDLLATWVEEVEFIGPSHFSPDGRWLTVRAVVPDSDEHLLLLYDMENQAVTRLPTGDVSPVFDWSLDGRWLAYQREMGLVVYFPESDAHASLANSTGCGDPLWVN